MNIEHLAEISFYVALVVVVVATVSTAVWASRDARRRGKSPRWVFLLVLLLQFPFGLIAWLVFRPAGPAVGGREGLGRDADAALKRRANEGRL